VNVGHDVSLQTLKPHYDAILFAYGASQDKLLGIPGEKLGGVYSARAFVGWYNGLPEYAHLNPTLNKGEDAVVIGQGNVALDVARILLSGVDALRKTDITEHALECLSNSKIKSVKVVGRRGPLQAAYTIKEVRELMNIPSVGFHPVDSSLLPPDLSKLPRAQKRIMEVIMKGSKTPMEASTRNWALRYFLSPQELRASPETPDQVSSVRFEQTVFSPESDPLDPKAGVQGSGTKAEVPSSVVFRSIGYKSSPLPGFSDLGIHFDTTSGTIYNDIYGHALYKPNSSSMDEPERPIPGLYCAGWVKKGPTGVVASTMLDAFSSADAIAADWNKRQSTPFLNGVGLKSSSGQGWEGVKSDVDSKGLRVVHWPDWKKIDHAEKMKGALRGKEREKTTSVQDMMRILDT
jgi:adrenodoxin-NADP+ reductase